MTVDKRLTANALHRQKLAHTKRRRKSMSDERVVEHAATSARRNDPAPRFVLSEVSPASLRPSPHRTRDTMPDHLAEMITSIATFGLCRPIVVAGDEIVDGHICVEAAIALGIERIAIVNLSHLSEVRIRALRLGLNKLGENGTYNFNRLKNEITFLLDQAIEIETTGFSAEEVDIILLDPDPGRDEADEIPEPQDAVVTAVGDVWTCGEHLVVAGDSTQPETYAVAFENDRAQAVISDFPYNVVVPGNVSGLGKKVHENFVMASGEMSTEQFRTFLTDTMASAKRFLDDGAVFFGFMDWRSVDLLYAAGRDAGFEIINLVVWYKGGGMGAMYRSAHELIVVFCNGDTPRVNNVKLGKNGRDRTNVWECAGANRRGSSAASMLHAHATPKPEEICIDAILDVTHRGETVLDPFLGSGTTLVAAEKCGRRCVGIELDSRFVDVAVRRWEALTGKQAILTATGKTFAETAAARLNEHDGTDEA